MAEQSAIIDGATNVSRSRESPPSKSSKLSLARSRKCPGKRLSARIGTSKSFARRIAWERLRRSNDSADFLNDSMEHAVQHASKYVEMLATFPHELKYFQV